jgi:hypothetical protein
MIDSLIRKRMFIALSGLILILISIYGYRITENRRTVRNKGQIVNAVVKRFSHGKNDIRTAYVDIRNKEYNAGDPIGRYSNCKIGDTIQVYWIADIEYVVLVDKNSITNFLIIEFIAFIIGLLLIILSPFLNEKKHKISLDKFNWIQDKELNTKNLDRYFNLLINNQNFMTRIDSNSLSLLNLKIVEIFNKSSNNMMIYLNDLLKHQDFKLDYIYFGLMDSDLFKIKFFETEFKKLFFDYLKNPSGYYEQIFQTFILSNYFDVNEKIRIEIINLIEANYGRLDNKSVDRLKKIIKTCT